MHANCPRSIYIYVTNYLTLNTINLTEFYRNPELYNSTWPEFLCPIPAESALLCDGSHGGPIICDKRVYGIASHRYLYGADVGGLMNESVCYRYEYQTRYLFVKKYYKWINDTAVVQISVGKVIKPCQKLFVMLLYTVDFFIITAYIVL